uniref:Uncharacterized protein n=1 Tax=Cryptomonas curvata TaxID=233186 RepID=A0A7S0MHZ9_9CRYP|mmetsp:Transcript_42343/g.88596  ORF Transcript_42343/g.88596 Transcript_42343/m.88596 type:complete len:131 (+) Transcript_42343:190-582(+)
MTTSCRMRTKPQMKFTATVWWSSWSLPLFVVATAISRQHHTRSRQLASLKSQQRQEFCLVEMHAPSNRKVTAIGQSYTVNFMNFFENMEATQKIPRIKNAIKKLVNSNDDTQAAAQLFNKVVARAMKELR